MSFNPREVALSLVFGAFFGICRALADSRKGDGKRGWDLFWDIVYHGATGAAGGLLMVPVGHVAHTQFPAFDLGWQLTLSGVVGWQGIAPTMTAIENLLKEGLKKNGLNVSETPADPPAVRGGASGALPAPEDSKPLD